MPQSHRLRLQDGSVIDLDRAGIRSWFESGVISVDSEVQKPGSREWTRLGQAMDVRDWRAPAKATGRSVPASKASRQGALKSRPTTLPRAVSGPPRAGRSELPWKRYAIVALGLSLLGAALHVSSSLWLPLILGSVEERRVRAATTTERELVDEALGLRLTVPKAWSLLKADHGLFVAPAHARLALAAPGEAALGYLTVVTPPRAFPSVDAYLTSVFEERRRSEPTLVEARREEEPSRGGRLLVATRETPDGPMDERISVWKEGWTYYTLVVWAPASRDTASAGMTTLLPSIVTQSSVGGSLRQALEIVTREVPLLSPRAAELLMGQSAAQVLDPAEAFRRMYFMTSRGLRALTPGEQRELGVLSTQLYAALPAGERSRLGSYIERVRNRQSTDPRLDAEMTRLAKAAALKMSPPRRARLQTLLEKAVAAGVATSG